MPELTSDVHVLVCGDAGRIPELPDLQHALRDLGYAVGHRHAIGDTEGYLSSAPGAGRVILLVHFPSFVPGRSDACAYQALLIRYAELKAQLATRNIETNLILFSYRHEGPLVGGWDYPWSAYVVQEVGPLIDFVRRAAKGSIRERSDRPTVGDGPRAYHRRLRGKTGSDGIQPGSNVRPAQPRFLVPWWVRIVCQ